MLKLVITMNTNINQVPDAAWLEQLANQIFSSDLPANPATSFPSAIGNSTTAIHEAPLQSIPANPHLALPSDAAVGPLQSAPISGLGAALPLNNEFNTLDLREGHSGLSHDAFSSHPVHSTANAEGIPVSVAGSGASPSAVEHGNNINIDNPQTGFPDRNLQSSQSASPFPVGNNAVYIPAGESFDQAIEQFLQAASGAFFPPVAAPSTSFLPDIATQFTQQPSYYFVN